MNLVSFVIALLLLLIALLLCIVISKKNRLYIKQSTKPEVITTKNEEAS